VLLERRVWYASAAELAAGVGVSVDDLLAASQSSSRFFVSPSRAGRGEGDRLVVLASEGVDSRDRAAVPLGTVVEAVLDEMRSPGERTVRIDGPVAVIAPHEHADINVNGTSARPDWPEHGVLVHRADGWHLLTDRGIARYGELPVDPSDTPLTAGRRINGIEFNEMGPEGFARMEAAVRGADAMTVRELVRATGESLQVVDWALGLSPRFIVSRSTSTEFRQPDRLVVLRPSGTPAQRPAGRPGDRLQIVEGWLRAGRRHEVGGSTAIVGDHPAADVVIGDGSGAAPVHAVFVELVDGWYVSDFPGGEARRVEDGERMRLGATRVRLRITAPDAGARPAR
jgi:hypothetical protein